SSQCQVGGPALAVPATGASFGFSTVTDHGTCAPGATGVGPLSAVAVTDLDDLRAGSVKFTVTGKGLTTTACAELLRTTPVTDVCTTGGKVESIDFDGTELSICWFIWSTVAATLPTGHTTWEAVGGPVETPAGPWATDDPVATPPEDEGAEDDEPCGAPCGIDVSVLPAPTAFWWELLTGLLVSGTRIWPLATRAIRTTAAAAAAPTGAASHRRASLVRAGSIGTTTGCGAGASSVFSGLARTRPMAAMTSAGGASAVAGAKCLMDQPVASRSSTPTISSKARLRVTSSGSMPWRRPSPARSSGSQCRRPFSSAVSSRMP